ncbi:MAG: hypothetical protein LQ350_005998 [Teloschistes chrysophthalmus]|nr:MAG: hypothetical protein LQ350_005998 [Niorma chrysophthalma]
MLAKARYKLEQVLPTLPALRNFDINRDLTTLNCDIEPIPSIASTLSQTRIAYKCSLNLYNALPAGKPSCPMVDYPEKALNWAEKESAGLVTGDLTREQIHYFTGQYAVAIREGTYAAGVMNVQEHEVSLESII